MFEQEAIRKKENFSIRTLMEKDDNVVGKEADLAKVNTTKSNPENITSITDKMFRTREAECPEEGGEQSCRIQSSKQLRLVWILWQVRTL